MLACPRQGQVEGEENQGNQKLEDERTGGTQQHFEIRRENVHWLNTREVHTDPIHGGYLPLINIASQWYTMKVKMFLKIEDR